MSILIQRCKNNIFFPLSRVFNSTFATTRTKPETNTEEFRVLQIKPERKQIKKKKEHIKKQPPRCNKMPVDQDWPSVWPGPRSFNPYVVPLPLRQGYTGNESMPPNKYANLELMKIPNFLHLTPPAIKRHCAVLEQFCTKWPEALNDENTCNKHFPVEIITSDYCYSSSTIRDPLARIVTLKINLNSLNLDAHAKDKFLRLVGHRYDPETHIITITADRCPMRKQNLEYVEYLLTALYHESQRTEAWESEKSELDMEYYDWDKSKSRETLIAISSWPELSTNIDIEDIPATTEYKIAVSELKNHGENQNTLNKYKEAVRNLHLFKYDISD